ncbi:hypothetical protein IAU59_001255 [Kwoniella sp. CBS 9459]
MLRPPRVKRYVDNVAVLRPRYYPDPGPEGFYPELQYPTQTRLAVKWNEYLGRETYIQLNAVFMTGIMRAFGREDVRAAFNDISRDIDITLFQVHAKHPEEMIAILEFPTPQQAEQAIRFANSNGRILGDGHFFARYADVNLKGPHAESTKDILLVREEFALSPPYTPLIGLNPPDQFFPPQPHRHASSPLDIGWHAVGYARDSFSTKRSLSEVDHQWSAPRKRRPNDQDIGHHREARHATSTQMYDDDTEYHPAWPNRDFRSPNQPNARRQTSHFGQKKRYNQSHERQASSSAPPAPLHLRIAAARSPALSSATSSECDLEKALVKSMAAAEALTGTTKTPFIKPFNNHKTHQFQISSPYERRRRTFKKYVSKGFPSAKHARYERKGQERSGRKLFSSHEDRQTRPRLLPDAEGKGAVAYHGRHTPHASTDTADPLLQLLEGFSLHSGPSVQPSETCFPHEPQYLAISADGNELFFASTYEAARLALSRSNKHHFEEQQELEVSVQEESEDESSDYSGDVGYNKDRSDPNDPIGLSAQIIPVAESEKLSGHDESASPTYHLPIDVGGLLSSLRGMFNVNHTKSIDIPQPTYVQVAEEYVQRHPALKEAARSVRHVWNPDHVGETPINLRQSDDSPTTLLAKTPGSPIIGGGRIYPISELDPRVLDKLGLEKRWTFRGSLQERWDSTAACLGDFMRLRQDGVEEGQVIEGVMKLTKPEKAHGVERESASEAAVRRLLGLELGESQPIPDADQHVSGFPDADSARPGSDGASELELVSDLCLTKGHDSPSGSSGRSMVATAVLRHDIPDHDMERNLRVVQSPLTPNLREKGCERKASKRTRVLI